jgi:hypothetical protein
MYPLPDYLLKKANNPMETENLDLESIMKERRKAIEQSLRRLSHQELTSIGETLFEKSPSHPWKAAFDQFLQENPYGTFYHAITNDKFQVIYCPEKEKGIWYLPGSGKGIMQPKGLKVMREILAAR